MLRNFAIALVATTLIAGPAFAAQSSDTAGTPSAKPAAPVTQAAPAVNAKQPAKQAVKETHVRKHVAHGKNGPMHQARHIRPVKTHQANVNAAAKRS
jgi:delta-aminolevulinic acid dehydratase/porphobilinogen synthase